MSVLSEDGMVRGKNGRNGGEREPFPHFKKYTYAKGETWCHTMVKVIMVREETESDEIKMV